MADVAPEPDPELEVVPPPPSLTDLLPRASDLQRFAGRAELPDPTAAGVREATLSLGTEDLRYRGYLETVHAAIDRSEKWKEAVLMGGGGGVVVVRMTVTSLGQLVSAVVTRSSGSHLLDSAALDAVERAHIPPFPSHWKVEKLHLHAQFNYALVTD
ncbi:MAG: energy transducer TonB [Deferrisomatales bacterium]|nr:energy transducer TonB [Deferrisomatales bacterium]